MLTEWLQPLMRIWSARTHCQPQVLKRQPETRSEPWSGVGFLIFVIFLISRNTKRYESLACFAKISLVSRNKNKQNFISFRFALQKLKRNFALFRKNLVLFRENFVSFRNSIKTRTTFSFA